MTWFYWVLWSIDLQWKSHWWLFIRIPIYCSDLGWVIVDPGWLSFQSPGPLVHTNDAFPARRRKCERVGQQGNRKHGASGIHKRRVFDIEPSCRLPVGVARTTSSHTETAKCRLIRHFFRLTAFLLFEFLSIITAVKDLLAIYTEIAP